MANANVQKRKSPGKPKCPKDFVLRPHASGKFRKTIGGKDYYFGEVVDGKPAHWKDALKEFNAAKSDLQEGRDPRQEKPGDQLQWLINHMLDDRLDKPADERLSKRTLDDYKRTGDRMVQCWGRTRNFKSLGPMNFKALRVSWPKTWGPTTRDSEIGRVRTILTHAWNIRVIDGPLYFGDFKQADKKRRRKHRAMKRRSKTNKQLTAVEFAMLVDAAPVQLRAMLLLGFGAGFNCSDCGRIDQQFVDLHSGWVEYERDKTYVPRMAWLWPEMIEAIEAAIEMRPDPVDPKHSDRIFMTSYGNPWHQDDVENDGDSWIEQRRYSPISTQTTALMKKLGINRPGVSFTACRSMTKTIGSRIDEEACKVVMGHDSGDEIGDIYDQEFDRTRVRAVGEGLRAWYLSGIEEMNNA